MTVSGGNSTEQNFTISCPEIAAPTHGTLWISAAHGVTRGLVVGFSGSYGIVKWVENVGMDIAWLNNLNSDGYEVVQVQWAPPGWEPASPGEQAGPAHSACRPATAIRWIYDNLYLGLHVAAPTRGACGFCIAGTSGGASVVAYVLAYYGLDSIVNAAFPISGPPHAAIKKGCLDEGGYGYDQIGGGEMATALIDSSWGYFHGSGPCTNHQSSFSTQWNAESADLGGASYNYPNTRVQVILGGYDSPVIIHHAQDYVSRLEGAGSPMVSETTVPGMPHDIMGSASGLAVLRTAIEARGFGANPTPSASAPPQASPSESPSTTGGTSPPARFDIIAGFDRVNPVLMAGLIAAMVLCGTLMIVNRGSFLRQVRTWLGRARARRTP